MTESVDAHLLRYTSIYSKLRAAWGENCFVCVFFLRPLRCGQYDWQM